MKETKIKLFDAFAGIGALHTAFKNIGVETELTGVSEIDPDAIISYAVIHNIKTNNIPLLEIDEIKKYLMDRNIGWDFTKKKSCIPRMKKDKLNLLYQSTIAMNNYGDVSLLNPNEIDDFDIFNFSFPCTDLSGAGKQKGMNNEDGSITRSGLYIYGINLIKCMKPKYIMIENVKALISKKFISDFNKIISQLNEIGYNCYYHKNNKSEPKCLNAKDYGIPQNRERIFVICVRKDVDDNSFEFPKTFDNGLRLKDMLEKEVDEKYYISDKCLQGILNSKFIQKQRQIQDVDEVCSTILARDYKDPKCVKVNCSSNELIQIGTLDIKGNDSIKRVYSSNGVSPTLTTMKGGNRQPKVLEDGFVARKYKEFIDKNGYLPEMFNPYNSTEIKDIATTVTTYCGSTTSSASVLISEMSMLDYKVRKLTPLECLRLMGFKDEVYYKIKSVGISDSQIYKMAGNSIVVNVLEEIFKNLFFTL